VTAHAAQTAPPAAANVRDAGNAAAAAAALAASLRTDCADGTIDGSYSHAVLARALAASSQQAGEYSNCQAALQQALLTK
jgi:hypothetical protein